MEKPPSDPQITNTTKRVLLQADHLCAGRGHFHTGRELEEITDPFPSTSSVKPPPFKQCNPPGGL